ncbi:MAG: hypothetical protein U9R39_07335 [Campylobacterota bacterium]|nr:hypothetical protein [Campylobacterota bacterium]
MIIIGDNYINYENISVINSIEDIKLTKPNTTVVFEFDKDLMKYCNQNDLNYAVKIVSIKESIYANNLNARYILPDNKLLEVVQKIAENYMFDSKILATIEKEQSIEDIALKSIDGVIFKRLINNN